MSGQIHRQKKNKDFVTIDTHCLRNPALKWDAKGLHSYLMQLPDDWKINIADLEKRSETGRDGTRAALNALLSAGYIFRERKQGGGGKFEGYDYHLFERPEHAEEWKTVNGKAVNGFADDGLTVNGKADATKYEESPTDFIKNEKTKDEEKAASPFPLPENENQTLKAEKNENDLQTGAGGAAGENPLTQPFTPVGTIEPQGATVIRMYDPQLPAVTIVDSVPATTHAQTEFRRVNIGEEIERLKTDELAKETFALVRKIPSNLFAEYVEAFGKEIGGTGETYHNLTAFRKHFFNWSGTRYEIAQKRQTQTNGKGSALTRAGGDLSKYQEEQIF